MSNSDFWKQYKEVDSMLKKAFIQMPGGQPPADPAAMGGDPSMGGMPPPGMDPAAMGGGALPTGEPAPPDSAPGSPMITISLDQLFEIIQKVLGLAKKVGVNGSGLQQAAPAPEAAPGLTQDQLKATIYEALGQMAG